MGEARTPADRQRAFESWLASLDAELRSEVPHDLLELTEQEMEDCDACREFLETFRRTVETCRSAPRPEVDRGCLERAAEAARRELREKGLL